MKERLTVNLNTEETNRLRKLSQHRQTSISSITRQVLKDFLDYTFSREGLN
jgi:predicted transcriptional regulator